MSRRNRRAARAHQTGIERAAPATENRYEEIIRFLTSRGLDELQVRGGSIPATALNFIADKVSTRLPADRPVRALHIGNFVGVSLCFISWLVQERHPQSVVVSIDPNVTHRGIRAPQDHVLALLHHFGLLENNVLIPGYTLEWTVGERGAEKVGVACERVLANLGSVCAEPFDIVVIDGNHEEEYLSMELEALRELLSGRSIVVFDDIVGWAGVVEVFKRTLEDDRFVELGQDGRVGIVQLTGGDTGPSGAGLDPATSSTSARP
jgi:Methyltransferase domain